MPPISGVHLFPERDYSECPAQLRGVDTPAKHCVHHNHKEGSGKMGNLYGIINGWRDSQRVPASWRQIALHIGLAPTTIKGWERGLRELPARGSLWAIHDLTLVPYRVIVQAAIDDAELFSVERGREDYVQRQAAKSAKPSEAGEGEKTGRQIGRAVKKSTSGTSRSGRSLERRE